MVGLAARAAARRAFDRNCERVFEEMISSRVPERKALREAFDYCSEDDVLVVTRLDQLRRSLMELIDHLIAGREVETK